MGIAKKFEQGLKKFLIGRWIQWPDKLIFHLSGKKSSGWVLGNKLKNLSGGLNIKKSRETVFLIGAFTRSGTSLLKTLIDQHQEICSPKMEVNIIQDINSKNHLQNEFGFSDEEIKQLMNKRSLEKTGFSERVLARFKKKKGADHILLKQPKQIYFIDTIFRHYPNAKFIHLIRDGREATMSRRYFLLPPGKKEWPYEWCCRQWAVAINKGRKWRGHKNYLELRYEDLLENPYEKMEEVFEFLGVSPLEKSKIDNYYQSESAKKYKTHPGVKKPLDPSRAHKWKNKMTEEDKKTFKRIAGKELIELGYEKDSNW